ncbi:YheC/YheD family protein [Gracilibacillus sp. S3-1-1]|uniref:YheC/YheD family protein n=1 Tax=Gracilibacillus pellucidus TaxID=3095368 RepID=A0ACC6M7Y9_9BACI|nr:YheC/YheD family protein [Gracilibacillus sp. S3-1-1]MDX8047098.1 YheC/YheD family protein [Gracilibacillus sp. S3-1-1]
MDQVGFFRWDYPLRSTMMLYSMIGKHYDLEVVFFKGDGVDMENELVTGIVLRKNHFEEITTKIPKIINNSPYKHDREDLHNFLSSRSHFMFKPFGGKLKEYKHFESEGSLKHILIPSTRIKNIAHVEKFVEQHSKVVFKPVNADKGQGIFSLAKQDDGYLYESRQISEQIEKENFQQFYNEHIKQKRLLMSKYIESKTVSGHPFDIRINFEKSHEGKWKTPQQYARVGYNDKVTSNLSTGGGSTRLSKFLQTEYSSSDINLINKQLTEITRKLPSVLEKMVDFEFNSIGLDLGIDNRTKKVYMFETNSYPGASNAIGQVALLRVGYMRYYLDNLS